MNSETKPAKKTIKATVGVTLRRLAFQQLFQLDEVGESAGSHGEARVSKLPGELGANGVDDANRVGDPFGSAADDLPARHPDG
jgi:hypothetical protein